MICCGCWKVGDTVANCTKSGGDRAKGDHSSFIGISAMAIAKNTIPVAGCRRDNTLQVNASIPVDCVQETCLEYMTYSTVELVPDAIHNHLGVQMETSSHDVSGRWKRLVPGK